MLSRWMNGKSDQRTRRWRMLTLSRVDFLRCCQEKLCWFFFFLLIFHSLVRGTCVGSPIKSINLYRTCFSYLFVAPADSVAHVFPFSADESRWQRRFILSLINCRVVSLNSNYCVKHNADKLLWTPSGPHKCSDPAVVSDMMSSDPSCSCPSSRTLSVQNGVDFVDWHHLWLLNSLRSRLPTGNSVHYCKNGVAYICFTAARVPLQPLCSLFNSLSLENS